jgi:OmpA-OmpF porin, OOP family
LYNIAVHILQVKEINLSAMNLNKHLVTGGLALMTAFSSIAQDTPVEEKGNFFDINKMSVGGAIGSALLHGDIRQYTYAPVVKYNSEYSLGAYIQGGMRLNHVISTNIQLGAGQLRGTRRKEGQSYMFSKAGYISSTLNLQVNLSSLFVSKPGSKFSYYASVGYGLVSFRAASYTLGEQNLLIKQFGYSINEDDPTAIGEKDEKTTESVIPLAFGLKYKLKPQLFLTAEIQGGMANTDKLDATVQGDAGDNYSLTSVGILYSFANSAEIEEWEDPLEAVIGQVEDIQTKVDGLTKDSDGDGVSDLNDKEPYTPAGVSVDGAGRALDVDGDGVPDHQDDEISARGAKVDGSGKELDSDGDGVADSKDMEPNSESGAMVNFQGVTITAKGSAAGGVSTGLPAVYFNLNSATIEYKSYGALADVAKFLKSNDAIKLTVIGHTDTSGSKSYNEKLGLRRAQSVIDHLAKVYGVDASRLAASSKGKQEPLAKGKASNINRRVDFNIAE